MVTPIGYDAENQAGSPAFPTLLIMVLAEREKRRENDRESLMPEEGWNFMQLLPVLPCPHP